MTTEVEGRVAGRQSGRKSRPVVRAAPKKGRVLVVEDEDLLRECLRPLLEEEGYDVAVAVNGRDALTRLYTETLPDIIVLDLRMPVMNGWEFRTIQQENPKLAVIPVVAISADGSEQAAAISANAYLRKPLDMTKLLVTIQRVLQRNDLQLTERSDETERLASLGRLAAGVAHEINNPLSFVLLNLSESLEVLRSSLEPPDDSREPEIAPALKVRLASVTSMLEDCLVGGERIRETVSNLRGLSRPDDEHHQNAIDIPKIIEQSVSMVWNQIRHRARLVKSFGPVPPIRGNGTALGQVFLNLLVNAAQAIPEGSADRNEIRIAISVVSGEKGREVAVEISDSGKGIAPEHLSRVFEPFFTTKAMGQGTGLGLSISRQTIRDHGGRIVVASEVGKGTMVRVNLPLREILSAPAADITKQTALARGRVLVIDDEPLIGRIVASALKSEHDVTVVQHASEAVQLLERGDVFDLVLCDVVMPDVSGSDFYAMVQERWPHLDSRLMFMTGGAFTSEIIEFVKRIPGRILTKPFKIEPLKRLVRERVEANAEK